MKFILVSATCLWAAACATVPGAPRFLVVTADAGTPTLRLRVPNAAAGTQTYRAVDPRGWGGQEATAPKAGGAKP